MLTSLRVATYVSLIAACGGNQAKGSDATPGSDAAPDAYIADAMPDAETCICPGQANAESICFDNGQCDYFCESGFSRCGTGNTCVVDAVDACGPSCEQCPDDPNGSAICVNGTCDVQCAPGYLRCDAGCCEYQSNAPIPQFAIPEGHKMTVDSQGYYHGIIRKRIDGRMYYVTNATGAWNVEAVGPWSSFKAEIVTGPRGPVILFQDYSEDKLKLAEKLPTGWQISTVAIQMQQNWASDIDVDDYGRLHICYETDDGKVYYGFRRGDSPWDIQEIRTDTGTSTTSCAIDERSGVVHIASCDSADDGNVSYTMIDSAGTISTVVADDAWGSCDQVDIAVDSSKIHILSYRDNHWEDSRYASSTDGITWSLDVVGGQGKNHSS